MFTVLAIIFTIVGALLFTRGGIDRTISDFKWTNNAGGYCLVIAAILWTVVFISLMARFIAWLWVHAP